MRMERGTNPSVSQYIPHTSELCLIRVNDLYELVFLYDRLDVPCAAKVPFRQQSKSSRSR